METHYEGQRERVRLIPESRINMKAKKDAEKTGQDVNTIITLGKRATKYVSSLIKPGDKVSI